MGAKYTLAQKKAIDNWVSKNRQRYNDYKRDSNLERYRRNKVKYDNQKKLRREFLRLCSIFNSFE